MPLAMARLRTLHGICPNEVLHFLLDLFKYNDNSKNKFSDNYYRAALVEAIVETLTPVVSAVLARTGLNQISSEALSSETKLILEEITRFFNMEKLLPSYHYTVTVSCLKAFRHLQKMGHLPNNPKLFQHYTQYGLFKLVRVTAVEALVDIIKVDQQKDYLMFLLNLVEFDPVPTFRYEILRLLAENPPISNKDTNSLLNTEEIVDKIWSLMNNHLSFDTRLRTACVDMYYAFYGRQRPACVPKPEFSVVLNLKEQKALVNHPTLQEENLNNTLSNSNNNNNLINEQQQQSFREREKESDHYQPVLDFDAAFNKRKLEDGEFDEFDEKFNKEKRLKSLDYENQFSGDKSSDYSLNQLNQTSNLASSINEEEDSNNKNKDSNSNLNQKQDSHHSDFYNEESNDFSTNFNSQVQASNLNEGLEDTDAQSYPPSSLLLDGDQQTEQSNQQQYPLTFSLSKQFGLTASNSSVIASTSSGLEMKEKVKEKKNKTKDKDRDRESSKEHKKKKKHKKKHKKHKKHEKREHSSELPCANSSSLPTLLKTDSSQLVMSDASDADSNPSKPNSP